MDSHISEPIKLSILIISSNQDTAQELVAALNQLSYYLPNITHTLKLPEAMDLISQHLFKIIFLDITNASLHPFESLDALSCETPGVSIIALLDSEEEPNSAQLLQRGAQDYLIKTNYSISLLERIFRYALNQQKNYQELMRLAQKDTLTGLANRYLFNDRIAQAIIRAERSKSQVALLFIDLDHFHGINNRLGYQVGDFLLKQTAQRIVSSVRKQDTVARLGSDEFAVILEGIHESRHVMSVTKQILQTFSEPILTKEEPIFISVSIGIALSSDAALDAQLLIKQADIARYRAKEKGRNTFQYFSSEHNVLAEQYLKLEQAMNYTLAKIFKPRST